MSLPRDAIYSIILTSGEFHNEQWNGGPNPPFVLHRVVPPRVIISTESNSSDDGDDCDGQEDEEDLLQVSSPPQISTLTSRKLTIHVSLTSIISPPGSVGAVYATECSIPDGNVDGFVVPSLVAKVANPFKTTDLVHEAAMYNEMEHIQGWGIPQCFGLFQFRSVEHFDFGPVSILLLERLGDCVHELDYYMGEKPTIPASIRDDLNKILLHISKLGIYYRYSDDIKPNHVLSTNTSISTGGVPPSPWRLIDFAFSKKKGHNLHDIQSMHSDQVRDFCAHYAMQVDDSQQL